MRSTALLGGLVVISACAFRQAPRIATDTAQATRLVDSGTFILTGPPGPGRTQSFTGTESFVILRQLAGDRGYLLTAVRRGGGRTTNDSLSTDSLGSPIHFHSRAFGGEASARNVVGDRAGDRYTISDPAGYNGGNFSLSGGTIVLDWFSYSDWHLVGLSATPRVISVIATDRGPSVKEQFSLVALGSEQIAIGRDTIAAVHFALGDGPARREVWFDTQHRVLKVRWQQTQTTGIRSAPPR